MHNIFRIVCSVFVLIALIGCSKNQMATPLSSTSQPTTQLINTQGAYLAPQMEQTGAYPFPPTSVANSNPLPKKIDVPNPNTNNGVVTGFLLIQGENKPYPGELYLGEMVLADQPGAPPLIGFSEKDSPKAEFDQSGRFVFKDVKPGDYGLILWNPVSYFLLNDPNSDKNIKVVVKIGEITDLGIVYVK
jgi:hypothetical protein